MGSVTSRLSLCHASSGQRRWPYATLILRVRRVDQISAIPQADASYRAAERGVDQISAIPQADASYRSAERGVDQISAIPQADAPSADLP